MEGSWDIVSGLAFPLLEQLSKAPSQTITFERLGTTTAIVTANPANIEHLLKTRFENYAKGDFFSSILYDLLGTGIFNVDGEHWRLQRKVASFEFNTRPCKMMSCLMGQ
ncbi:hypothetical protein SUGI_0632790 [Cryptomeria japonica]|nr:hypothetical protein SUGI_0632790 [Cryptomeria japonica]